MSQAGGKRVVGERRQERRDAGRKRGADAAANEGRTPERINYRTDDWQLILVGHDRAFSNDKDRPRHLEAVDLEVGEGWRAALRALTDDVIEREFDGLLDKRRRNALAARRDALLAD